MILTKIEQAGGLYYSIEVREPDSSFDKERFVELLFKSEDSTGDFSAGRILLSKKEAKIIALTMLELSKND